MAGKRQHYIPRFLQRGFLAERSDNAERTWLHRRGTVAKLVAIRDVGVGEFFYSKLSATDEETLDDLITAIEGDVLTDLHAIRRAPQGRIIEPGIPARVTTHLVLRTAHLRAVFQQITALFLDQFSAVVSDPDQLRNLIGLDSSAMSRVQAAIDDELLSSPIGSQLPRPFLRRVMAFQLRESFTEVWASQMPMVAGAMNELVKAIPAIIRDGHNKALRTEKPTQWESDLAQLCWRTHKVAGAILPDCIALAQTGGDTLTPLILKEDQLPDVIILPIAHNLLLVGSRGEPIGIGIDVVNAASAACSDSFFIASNSCDSADLVSLIGGYSSLAIKRVIDKAMAGVHPLGSELFCESLDIVPVVSVGNVNNFSFSLVCQDFADRETAEKLGGVMQVITHELSRNLPLSQLDGVTFAADYAGALVRLDRGDSTLQADKTRPRTYGQAVAKRVHVIRNGEGKEHLVFDASIALSLLDADDEKRALALHLIVSMLASVAHGSLYEQRLPSMSQESVDIVISRLHAGSSTAAGKYFAARTSAFSDITAGERFATLFLKSMHSAQQVIRSARQVYLVDQAMDPLLDVAVLQVSFVLDHAAEWLGHRDGIPAQTQFPGDSLPDKLKLQGLHDWLELFGLDLRRLYDSDDHFTADNIFALSRHVERLLWTMGLFPWPTEDGGLYVSLGPIK